MEQERINLLTIPMGAKRSPDVDDIYNLLMSKGFQMSLEEAQSGWEAPKIMQQVGCPEWKVVDSRRS